MKNTYHIQLSGKCNHIQLCIITMIQKKIYIYKLKQSKRKYCMEWESGTRKSVDLEHTDLEVTADAERGVVERQAAVCFAVANVLVHPNRLALSVHRSHCEYYITF